MADDNKRHPTYATDFIKADSDQAVFLGNPLFDNMMTSMVALGAEVWSNRRRMRVIEKLLAEHGAVTNEMIEAYLPGEEEEAAMQAERDSFIQRTFGTLARETRQED